jgi:hypothetical protein
LIASDPSNGPNVRANKAGPLAMGYSDGTF